MHILKQFITPLFFLSFSFSALANFTALTEFGANPGSLSASYYSPAQPSSALVVLLHGCVQNGEQLARKSGLLALAKKHNFALLVPQQSEKNNIKRCFNWYSSDDFTKGEGESLSLKNMIAGLQLKLASDNVYIIGLSGGGAMASIMLANYPELFTAGAVVAGIPFPCADGLITGISCMKNGPSQTASELAVQIKKLHPKQTVWPKLSIWTGMEDKIVNPVNAQIFAQQWVALLALSRKPLIANHATYKITSWQDAEQHTQVELVEVSGQGHGIMVNPNTALGGEVADYLLAAPISTAMHLVNFWQLD